MWNFRTIHHSIIVVTSHRSPRFSFHISRDKHGETYSNFICYWKSQYADILEENINNCWYPPNYNLDYYEILSVIYITIYHKCSYSTNYLRSLSLFTNRLQRNKTVYTFQMNTCLWLQASWELSWAGITPQRNQKYI